MYDNQPDSNLSSATEAKQIAGPREMLGRFAGPALSRRGHTDSR